MTCLLHVPRSALAALFMADASYPCLLLVHFVLWQSKWELMSSLAVLSCFLYKPGPSTNKLLCSLHTSCLFFARLIHQLWQWKSYVPPWSVVWISMDYMTLYTKRQNASILMNVSYFVKTIFTKLTAISDESRHNSISLNKDYISNKTLNIPNYYPTPNINIITNIIEDSYITYTSSSNQDQPQKPKYSHEQ
jgi:hypothetical protein